MPAGIAPTPIVRSILRTGITAGFEPAGGGYAQYVRVMAFVLPGVVKLPPRNSFLEGAMLEPVNTVLKGVRRLALLPGDTVLVAGQGPIGLMFTRLLALRKANVIASDRLEPRLVLARELGAIRTVQVGTATPAGGNDAAGGDRLAEVVAQLTQGRGVDAAVIAVPLDAVVTQAQGLLRGGGQVFVFAHTRRGVQTPLDLATVCVDEKDLIGSYSSDLSLQPEAARLVFSRRLDTRRLVTHQFPLDQTAAAVALAAKPTPDSLKVVVNHDLTPPDD